MELKVVCDCGQKYKFDVEPINGQMPFTVNCPACGIEGTQSANSQIAQFAVPEPALTVASAPSFRAAASPPVAPPRPAAAQPKYMQNNPAIQNNSILMGLGGGLIGAGVAVGLMVAFTMFTGMKFPLMGTIMGVIIGFGAKIGYKGTDSTLGAIAAGLAFVSIAGTLLLMFNIFSIMLTGVISLLVGVSMAWKIAS